MTSPATRDYNCFAWAIQSTNDWFEVTDPRDVESLMETFGRAGFAVCEDASFETGYTKIADYADAFGPTHAARQLLNGSWTSKLGDWEDIEHETLSAHKGSFYGNVVAIMMRSAVEA